MKDLDINEMRQAIHKLASTLPIGISIRSFINEDRSIDYELLKPMLKGVPVKTYYMSRETYEVFEDRETAECMDQVQLAVDLYVKEQGKWPVAEGDSRGKISYFLIQNYLRTIPEETMYVDKEQGLVSFSPPTSD
ncbi:DUF3939 domain-containing protein [Salsuginibacillus kocurii]|uniref:DUF3939 domain-containing protein n=1 Tax=Salsuginibacillus kocurii TaxID=427078 RepID=UPI00037C62C6|nr:DUF3939 domain-containing protein [Salsuginibacillus kocurii]